MAGRPAWWRGPGGGRRSGLGEARGCGPVTEQGPPPSHREGSSRPPFGRWGVSTGSAGVMGACVQRSSAARPGWLGAGDAQSSGPDKSGGRGPMTEWRPPTTYTQKRVPASLSC
ncbi:hypothetical protein NDU88_005807 [Pleurodeles waltl]|uniref:Uncharacterized protein n=1 Tax=Pleurodeles waltl TaxID=8319 RepID=A0AAV7WD00_PLEWA|nr:hypothetical protein NDU88_005807 [Pleurodeles waltl]